MKSIDLLQTLPTEKLFNRDSKLFISEQSDSEFSRFFKESFLIKIKFWAERYSRGHLPSTNNALESTNAVIKDSKAYRERLPRNIFMKKLEDIVSLMKWNYLFNQPNVYSYFPQ